MNRHHDMKPELSLYLDVVRFAAALTVFVAHFALQRLSGGMLWQLRPLGHEAVTVFFVLSGYVIAYATATRDDGVRDFAISRAARIYSVALPAVLLTAALDEIGSRIDPASYSGFGIVQDLSLWRFFSALSFTNELWTVSVRQGSNAAYWSLGYEVPFYLIFALALFTPPRWRGWAVAAALLAVGPSIAVALPLWLAGAAAYHYSQRRTLSSRSGMLLFAGSCLAWLGYEIIVLKLGRPIIEGNVFFKRKEIVQDYIVCLLFTMNLIGFHAAAQQLGGWLLARAKMIRWMAGATFTLYLCHLSIAQFLVALSPWPIGDARSRLLVFVGTLAAVFALATLTERRKRFWRRLFEAAWPGSGLRALPGHPP